MVCVPPSTHNKYICGHQSVSALENEKCSTLGYVCTVPPYTPTPTPIPLLCSAVWGDNRSILCGKISPLVGVLGTCAQTYAHTYTRTHACMHVCRHTCVHAHMQTYTQCTLLSNPVHLSAILSAGIWIITSLISGGTLLNGSGTRLVMPLPEMGLCVTTITYYGNKLWYICDKFNLFWRCAMVCTWYTPDHVPHNHGKQYIIHLWDACITRFTW